MALPPYAAFIGARLDEGTEPVLVMPFGESVLGRPGFLHGGAIAGLMEMAALVALERVLAGQGRIAPVTMTVDFMRGGRDADTRALGTVVMLGRRTARVDAVAWQEDRGRLIAGARMNWLVKA